MSSPSLDPQVTAPANLVKMERAILELIKGEGPHATFRTSLCLDASLALCAVRAAAIERRDFANLIAAVLDEYLERNGAPSGEIAEVLEKAGAALGDDPELAGPLAEFLATYRRKRPRAAAAAR